MLLAMGAMSLRSIACLVLVWNSLLALLGFVLSGCGWDSSQNQGLLGVVSLAADFLVQVLALSKYHQNGKISKYQNIGCIEADFDERGRIFQHFSRSFRKISWKLLKTLEIVKNLGTKLLKCSENSSKFLYFDTLGVFLYFDTLLVFCTFILKFAKICS